MNFWPKAGMRHYSDALVGILAKDNKVYYFSNYKSLIDCDNTVFDLSLNPFRIKNFAELYKIYEKLAELKPDAVHLNSGYPALLPLYLLMPFFNSVVTVHDAVTHEGESIAKAAFHRIQLFFFSIFFKKIIVHSEKIKNQLPFYVNKNKIFIIPHVSYRHLSVSSPQGIVKQDGKFTVLFFGRILKYKGLEYLVDAFKSLDKDRYQLIIAGEGQIDFDVSQQNITIINRYISDLELSELFAIADVVVIPYISASQSGVAQLSLAFNKPVIATDVGSIIDIVINRVNGLIVPPRSAKDINIAIKLISDHTVYGDMLKQIQSANNSNDLDTLNVLLNIYGAKVWV